MAAGGAMCLFQLCFRSYFQVFHLYVAYVAMATYVCCKYMFQTFQLFETYVSRVSSVCFMCFIFMLQKDMMLHILQWLHTYVLSVCPHVSSVLDVCCKCMFQMQTMFNVFHLYVAMTIQVCFNSILHMLQWLDECYT